MPARCTFVFSGRHACSGPDQPRLEAVTEDGAVVQKFTGTVFADVWKTVPVAGRVLNRGNTLEPESVGFARKNLAYLPRSPWDGHGLPLRMRSAVGEGQVITADAVEAIPVVTKGQVVLWFIPAGP